MFFSSLKEAHNNLCVGKTSYKWNGCPFIDRDGASVSEYQCKKCGIKIWQMRLGERTYTKIPSEFSWDEGLIEGRD